MFIHVQQELTIIVIDITVLITTELMYIEDMAIHHGLISTVIIRDIDIQITTTTICIEVTEAQSMFTGSFIVQLMEMVTETITVTHTGYSTDTVTDTQELTDVIIS
jgi:hypothetical protein